MEFLFDPGHPVGPERRFGWLETVIEDVSREAARHGLDEDGIYYLVAAAREAIVNALNHGQDARGVARVRVELACDRGTLALTVQDHGRGFDPTEVPDPLSEAGCWRTSGRGLLLMRRFADRVVYSFPEGGGSEVRLEKRLPAPSPATPRAAAARPRRGRRSAPA
jgi:serine/threonine-protein kinase RsbW